MKMKRIIAYSLFLLVLSRALVSCTGEDPDPSAFLPPEIVSLSAEPSGNSVTLLCKVSSSYFDKCGFYFGPSDGEKPEYKAETIDGTSFRLIIPDLGYDMDYSCVAFCKMGEKEIRSQSVSVRTEVMKYVPIPDPAFKKWLVERYDRDADEEISPKEALAITEIEMPSNQYNLHSLKGIEYMPNLEVINCWGGWMGTKDAPEDHGFEHYYIGPYENAWPDCWGPVGTLEYIDVSANPKLRILNLDCNSALGVTIGVLDLSNNPLLEELQIGMTYMEYPDVSAQKNTLKVLNFSHGRGCVPVDLGDCILLESIDCSYPQDNSASSEDIAMLDLSNLSRLNYLNLCEHPGVRGLKLSANGAAALKEVRLCGCKLSSIDLTPFVNLEVLELNSNPITSLDLSNNTKLEFFSIGSNHNLTNDNVVFPDAPDLDQFNVDNTQISSLDLSKYPKLTGLYTNGSAITVLDISENPLLERMNVYSPVLQTLIMNKDQHIEGINVNRSDEMIHPETYIRYTNEIFVGDYTDKYGGGVVCWLSPDGKECNLLSRFDIFGLNWYEAAEWCASYGDGTWRLPSIEELNDVYQNLDAVNRSLSDNKCVPICLENYCYWSSTENGDYALRFHFNDGVIFYEGTDELKTCTYNYTRAVKTVRTAELFDLQ